MREAYLTEAPVQQSNSSVMYNSSEGLARHPASHFRPPYLNRPEPGPRAQQHPVVLGVDQMQVCGGRNRSKIGFYEALAVAKLSFSLLCFQSLYFAGSHQKVYLSFAVM